mmetsp:Transcript_665/g.2786  ORF Transcript_665/g.2786 Transcript_665/m.2786 type:complete len:371 (+) Transcript_665:430-1542(+)
MARSARAIGRLNVDRVVEARPRSCTQTEPITQAVLCSRRRHHLGRPALRKLSTSTRRELALFNGELLQHSLDAAVLHRRIGISEALHVLPQETICHTSRRSGGEGAPFVRHGTDKHGLVCIRTRVVLAKRGAHRAREHLAIVAREVHAFLAQEALHAKVVHALVHEVRCIHRHQARDGRATGRVHASLAQGGCRFRGRLQEHRGLHARTLGDGSMEQALGHWGLVQHTHRAATCRLTPQCNASRITTKARDVLLNPFEALDLVAQASVRGHRVVTRRLHEAEQSEAVLKRDDDNIALLDHLVKSSNVNSSLDEVPTMDPNHYGSVLLRWASRHKHGQREAVLHTRPGPSGAPPICLKAWLVHHSPIDYCT